MKPEYDRKGRASASAGSGVTIIRLPTDKEKTSSVFKSRTEPPFFLQKENQGEGDIGPEVTKYTVYALT